MKPLVNLATEPFRNRRLFWLAVLLLFLLPAYFGRQAIKQMNEREREIADRQKIVSELESRLKKVEKPGGPSLAISQEQNRELFAASELLARKAFSWSQLLNDIERNLPPGVRLLRVAVTTIVPEEKNGAFGGPDSAASLNIEVIGKSNMEVTTMINRFHDSGRFKVAPVTQKPVEGTEEVEFALKVEYFPQPAASQATMTAGVQNQIAVTEKQR